MSSDITNNISTTATILKMNRAEESIPLIWEVCRANPEINFFHAAATKKNSYYSLFVTAEPTVGFREPGTDRTFSNVQIDTRLHELKNFDASWEHEIAKAEMVDKGPAYVCALQQRAHMKAAMAGISNNIWYGDAQSAYGFDGLFKLCAAQNDKVLVANKNAAIADGSSVFLVCTGPEYVGINWGNDGILNDSDVIRQKIGSFGSGRWCFEQRIEGFVGVEYLDRHSVVMITGLSATGSLAGLTDSILAQAREMFPVGYTPLGIFMSRRSRLQLRNSRYLKSAPEQGAYAPLPIEFDGIPIYVTDAIVDNEDYTSLASIANLGDSSSGSGESGSGESGSGESGSGESGSDESGTGD